ncbi:MAG TPA: radical SAM protein, partial [Silvibacterium sp.]|nr:radical SAM protein [Silvibacterium sp.]
MESTQTAATRQSLYEHIDRHPSLPPEAVVKADLLRRGLSFAPETLIQSGSQEHQPKSYFIFSFNMVPQAALDSVLQWKSPEEIALTEGPLELRRTIVSVRLNPASPYRVVMHEGERWVTVDGELLARVALPPMPSHYGERLPDGRPVAEIAPTIEWGYLIYLTIFRICQYFGEKEECQFCDINHNYREQIAARRPYTGVKKIEDILLAL